MMILYGELAELRAWARLDNATGNMVGSGPAQQQWATDLQYEHPEVLGSEQEQKMLIKRCRNRRDNPMAVVLGFEEACVPRARI